jgi:hypothetical protein
MTSEKWNILIAWLAVIAAWAPLIIQYFTKSDIKGKIISLYGMNGSFAGSPASVFIFKLSVISLDSEYNLMDIDINIHYKNQGWKNVSSINQRRTDFMIDGVFKKFTVGSDEYLNNLTILPKNETKVGYLLTYVPNADATDDILEYQFLFRDFSNNIKILKFPKKDIQSEKMLHDDSIWT